MTLCSSLQPVVVYNFSEIESTFTVPFWDYLADCWWLRGMFSICLIRNEIRLTPAQRTSPWLDIFLLYLLQYICCSKYSAKTTNFSIFNLFLHFLHPFVLKNFRNFVTVIQPKFHWLLKTFSTGGTRKRILLILSCGVLLAWFNMLEISSIEIILYLHSRNDIGILKLWR